MPATTVQGLQQQRSRKQPNANNIRRTPVRTVMPATEGALVKAEKQLQGRRNNRRSQQRKEHQQ